MLVGLELFDDGVDSLVVLEIVLNDVAEQLGLRVLLEDLVSDLELYGLCVAGVEDGVDGFGGVVDVEVSDEAGEL